MGNYAELFLHANSHFHSNRTRPEDSPVRAPGQHVRNSGDYGITPPLLQLPFPPQRHGLSSTLLISNKQVAFRSITENLTCT